MFKLELIVSESVLEKTKHGDLITIAKDSNGKKAFGARCVVEHGKCLLTHFRQLIADFRLNFRLTD